MTSTTVVTETYEVSMEALVKPEVSALDLLDVLVDLEDDLIDHCTSLYKFCEADVAGDDLRILIDVMDDQVRHTYFNVRLPEDNRTKVTQEHIQKWDAATRDYVEELPQELEVAATINATIRRQTMRF